MLPRSAEGETAVVIRNSTSTDDKSLAAEHSRRVGDLALDFVLERFDNLTVGKVVVERGMPLDALEANVNKLCVLIAVLGFCVDASATLKGKALECKFLYPANYWGLKSLAGSPLSSRPLQNDFGAKIVAAYLARTGTAGAGASRLSKYATTFDASSYTHTFRL